jgi:inorganic pyrophosphatase
MSKLDSLPVLIEAPEGSRSKLAFDFEIGHLRLTKVLPAGYTFPFNFGSIPCTKAEDGDPVDILLFMSDPVPPGSLVAARLIGVLEAEQWEKDGKAERNDRLVGVARDSTEHRHLRSVSGMEPAIRKQIERFFEDYNSQEGKKFKALGWFGPKRAGKLFKRARQAYKAPKTKRRPATFAEYRESVTSV